MPRYFARTSAGSSVSDSGRPLYVLKNDAGTCAEWRVSGMGSFISLFRRFCLEGRFLGHR